MNNEKYLKNIIKLMIFISFSLSIFCFIHELFFFHHVNEVEIKNLENSYLSLSVDYKESIKWNSIDKNEIKNIKKELKKTEYQMNVDKYGKIMAFHIQHPILSICLFPIFILWYFFFCWPWFLCPFILDWIVGIIWYGLIFYNVIKIINTTDREKDMAMCVMTF